MTTKDYVHLGQPLSAREYEALAFYARLGDQKTAAHALGISMQTIKNHLSNCYLKLGVQTNLQAFRQMGWLRAPDDTQLRAEMESAARLTKLERRLRAITTEVERMSRHPWQDGTLDEAAG